MTVSESAYRSAWPPFNNADVAYHALIEEHDDHDCGRWCSFDAHPPTDWWRTQTSLLDRPPFPWAGTKYPRREVSCGEQ